MILSDGTEIIPIHLVYPDEVDDRLMRIACIPGFDFVRGVAFPWLRSDDPRAVNCPLCKETSEYKVGIAEIASHRRRRIG